METCEICYEKFPSSNFQELICGHKFCLVCLRSYLEIKIWTETVFKNEIICLRHSCGTPLNIYMVKEILPPDLWKKYEILWKNQIKLEVEGESQMSERTKRVRIYEDLFEHLIFKMGWKRCPICNCAIEKIGRACNYVYCESKTCQKKTVFCYICGKKIKNPKTHFQNNKCYDTIKKNDSENSKKTVDFDEKLSNITTKTDLLTEKPKQILTITEEQYGDDESKDDYNPNASDLKKNQENLKKKEEEEITEEWNKNYGKNNINEIRKKEVFNADEENTVELNKMQTVNLNIKSTEENEKIDQMKKQKNDADEEETAETTHKNINEEKKWDGSGKFKEWKKEKKNEERKNKKKLNFEPYERQPNAKKPKKQSDFYGELKIKQGEFEKNAQIKNENVYFYKCLLI